MREAMKRVLWFTVASMVKETHMCVWFQIRINHRAFGPAAGNQVLRWILEAAGRSHSGRNLRKKGSEKRGSDLCI